MAWRRTGDKPLSEPMMVSLPTYLCITRPQWVNVFESDLYFIFICTFLLAAICYMNAWGSRQNGRHFRDNILKSIFLTKILFWFQLTITQPNGTKPLPDHAEPVLTHWGRVTHICVSKLTTIGWDNGLSPGRRQAIIWTNDGILLIRTLGTNFSEILGEIHSFSFKKMHLKMSSAGGHLFSLGLNELTHPRCCVAFWRVLS